MRSNWYKIIEGATPKLTTSLKESNCLPISEEALKSRARKPSRKSIMAAANIKREPCQIFSGSTTWVAPVASNVTIVSPVCRINTIAMQPEIRFNNVKRFGICFIQAGEVTDLAFRHYGFDFFYGNWNTFKQIHVPIFGDPDIIFNPDSHLFLFNINP